MLREWRSHEGDAFYRWIADPSVNKFLTWAAKSRVKSDDQLRQTLEAQKEVPRMKYFLAMELLKNPGTTIGDAGFTWIERGVAEIGYFLEPHYWGKGLATEAALAIANLAFDQGAKLVIATCAAENTASEMVMKRCGMTRRESSNRERLEYQIAPAQ